MNWTFGLIREKDRTNLGSFPPGSWHLHIADCGKLCFQNSNVQTQNFTKTSWSMLKHQLGGKKPDKITWTNSSTYDRLYIPVPNLDTSRLVLFNWSVVYFTILNQNPTFDFVVGETHHRSIWDVIGQQRYTPNLLKYYYVCLCQVFT